ncbi:Putative redox-active protein (C_GCAxxG_C_C) [Butyrivibrio sp. INlla18]|uniref:C-GCAxxG-C-C family protein n=1 Tax=Butyrivibrio sp. INlla18 TaxID=1520806 RepID=UPI0008838C17|nr:C-GCAxxG-C-C family protein [Butyrivibrio sp. INlla18]SDA58758.1 Putative redox-active protein (C_GCAxxG_C_C) [Butyrivibrio sp. INlla18]
MSKAIEAKNKFGKMMCAAAVLTTYADEAGISKVKAMAMGPAMSGGRMVKCGAVLAAEEVLKKQAPDKIPELERRFGEKNGSLLCAELKGRTGGPVLQSCPGCIEDASVILEELLG